MMLAPQSTEQDFRGVWVIWAYVCARVTTKNSKSLTQQEYLFSYAPDDKDMTHAFDIANEASLQNKKPQNAVTIGAVRLYSYANPALESGSLWNHISPPRIYDRLRHADRKNSLHFDSRGNIYRPGLEVSLPSQDDAYRLKKALTPLTPPYSPLLSPLWRLIIRSIVYLLTIRRRFAGERILAFYCAEDRSYFGSVYFNAKGQFFSVHGLTREVVERGARRLISLLSAP